MNFGFPYRWLAYSILLSHVCHELVFTIRYTVICNPWQMIWMAVFDWLMESFNMLRPYTSLFVCRLPGHNRGYHRSFVALGKLSSLP